LSRGQVVDHVFECLSRGVGGWLITMNVDHLHRYVSDAKIRTLCSGADIVVADGVPLLWACRLKQTPLPDRVAGSDLVWLLAERAARHGRSLFLLGGGPGVAEAAGRRLVERWPELRIAGTVSPWVSTIPEENEIAELRALLEAAKPDLVYVALGAPKQEFLIAALRESLPSTWWLGVGISLSFIAEDVPRAPRWMQRTGLEWLHRLLHEPRRLARRYLVNDLPFTLRLLVRAWRARR
jgi:N-acetylglucosaminyldiphosphoundecaprenol N-acetyl-beta-D-mannosaminyltransferase